MSINGLEASSIKEAYEAILQDSGGWLLLHYTSRDDVDLHSRGTRGPPELQSALERYTEKSPLYGFLVFRRRKFVLKYVPDGTSRLLQARTTVHFQTVLDHFSPHDDTITATSPDSVSESALYSRRAIHTANSSSSVQRVTKNQQLDEISEDVEVLHSPKPDVASILARIREDKQIVNQTPTRDIIEDQEELQVKEADRDSIDDLFNLPRKKKGRSMDIKDALALDMDDISGSEDSAVHSMGYRRGSRGRAEADELRPSTAVVSTPAPRGWKPKIRLFTRTIDEPQSEDAKQRAKLPNGLHIRHAEEEAAKARATKDQESRSAARIKSPKSPKRPKYSRNKDSRSSQRTNEINRNDVVGSAGGTRDNADPFHKRDAPPTADTLSTTSATEAWLSQNKAIDAAGISSVTTLGAGPDPLAEQARVVDNETSPAKPRLPTVTPERQRLLKAMELRKKQQQNKASVGASETGTRHTTSEQTIDKQTMQSQVGSHDPSMQAAENPASEQAPVVLPKSSEAVTQTTPVQQVDRTTEEFDPYRYSEAEKDVPVMTPGMQVGTKAGANDDPKRDYFSRPSSGSKDPSRKSKRRTLKSIHTSNNADHSDVSSEGSFMDELQNATLHEATQVSVPQTPVTPSISDGRLSPRIEEAMQRQVSASSARSALFQLATRESGRSAEKNTVEPLAVGQALASPAVINIRKPSLNRPPGSVGAGTSIGAPASNATASKKTNVSSGISRRIQALEERSQRSTSPVSVSGRTPLDMTMPFGNSQIHNRAMSLTNRPSSRGSSQIGASRTLFRPKPMASIVDVATSGPPTLDGPSTSKSFTARIVRSPQKKDRAGSPDRRSPKKASFQRSQVTLDTKSNAASHTITQPDQQPSVTAPRPASRGSAVSGMPRSSVDFGLSFLGRKKSENRSPTRTEKSPSVGSLEAVQENGEQKKKESKTSRFFKRMSGLSNKSKKSPSDDGTRTLNSIEGRNLATAPSVARLSLYIVGDLNVQFPDTLFWKRRWVEIDGAGNLVLSGSRGTDVRTPPKKYHISSFEHPTIPGPDRQEMPYSIVLDSVSGGTLQFASDDRVSQAQVMKRLSDAHRAWTS